MKNILIAKWVRQEYFYKFIFNWMIIALQNFVFSVKLQHESAIGIHMTYVPPHLVPPSHLPPLPTPLAWYRAAVWVSWDIQLIPIGYLFYIWQCKLKKNPTGRTRMVSWRGRAWVGSLNIIGKNKKVFPTSGLASSRHSAWSLKYV